VCSTRIAAPEATHGVWEWPLPPRNHEPNVSANIEQSTSGRWRCTSEACRGKLAGGGQLSESPRQRAEGRCTGAPDLPDALSTFCARVRRCAVSDERAFRAAVRLWCRVVARCSRSHEGLETTPENREADQHREPHDERGGEGDVPLAHLLCGRHRDVCILIDHGGHRMRLACASRHASAHRREGAGVCAACSVRSSVPPRARTHAPYLISRYLGDTRSDPNARSESRQRRKTPRSRENAPEDVADRTPTRRSVR